MVLNQNKRHINTALNMTDLICADMASELFVPVLSFL